MNKYIVVLLSVVMSVSLTGCLGSGDNAGIGTNDMIIDHQCTNISSVPISAITQAKSNLHIYYGHTSHGSQLVTDMPSLDTFMGGTSLFTYNSSGSGGALHIFENGIDLGNPDLTTWESQTRTYLNAHSEINVVMWSWCGQVSGLSSTDINNYLNLMHGLEDDYPGVKFVYMTGHLDGSGLAGNLHQRNEQIRTFCRANNKILYDFEDIESYNPDGTYYGDKYPTDGCYYDSNGDGSPEYDDGSNWAKVWQAAHDGTDTKAAGGQWYNCSPAHSEAVNGNLKAYAAWWLWSRLAGWDGN